MPACPEIEFLLALSLDGTLTEAEAALVEAHLAICPACRALAGDLTEQSAAVAALSATAPDLLVAQVLARIRPARKPAHWRRWAAMAAVFVLAVVGGTGLHWLADSRTVPPATFAPMADEDSTTMDAASSSEAVPFSGEADGGSDLATFIAPNPADAPDESGTADSAQPASTPAPEAVPGVATASGAESRTAPKAVAPAAAPADDQPVQGASPSESPTPESAPEPAQPDTATPAPVQARQAVLPPEPSSLTPAEAEGVLRTHLGDGAVVLSFSGVLPGGGFYRFDCADTGEAYAVSMDGQQIVAQSSPESDLIADWDTQ